VYGGLIARFESQVFSGYSKYSWVSSKSLFVWWHG